eukprot:83096-Chlamydomonas_euryale.AAC.5
MDAWLCSHTECKACACMHQMSSRARDLHVWWSLSRTSTLHAAIAVRLGPGGNPHFCGRPATCCSVPDERQRPSR